jgi:type III secretory pathway component EscR
VANGESSTGRAVASVLLYVVARLALVAALTAVIYGIGRALGVQEFPIVIAMLFSLVIAMPLGMWLFAPLRRRATAGLDEVNARRRHDREQLQARLRGEEPPAD